MDRISKKKKIYLIGIFWISILGVQGLMIFGNNIDEFGYQSTNALIFSPSSLINNLDSEPNLATNEADNSSLGSSAGQELVDVFRQVFQYDWMYGVEYDPNVDGMGFAQSRTIYGSGYDPLPAENITDNMSILPILSPDNSEKKIIELVKSANKSLFIEQMYIYSSLTELLDEIIAAYNRGVNVSVILDDGSDESNITASILNNKGISVKINTGAVPMYFDTMHNKGVIVDGKSVLIASVNWSPTSLRENREAGLIINSESVASYYTKLFYKDWDVCVPYDPLSSFSGFSVLFDFQEEKSSMKKPISSSPENYTMPFANLETITGVFDVTTLAAPDNCYESVARVLSLAKTSIDISVYTLSSPYLLDILYEKIANGVKVRLLLEKNQVGSYERNYNRWTMMNLTVLGAPSTDGSGKNLTADGLWANPDFDFQHSKYAIIDNQTLILSSGNWGRSSCPKPQPDGDVDGNRDWWIIIYGENPGFIDNTLTDSNENNSDDYIEIGSMSSIVLLSVSLISIILLVIKEKRVKLSTL